MKKIALFVEGQTEQIFIEKLIREIIGRHGFSIENYKFINENKLESIPLWFSAKNNNGHSEYCFIIYDCCGDDSVQSFIRERLDSLQSEAFSMVIGIRDVFPETNIEKIKQHLYFGIPENQKHLTNIILAINETEAWFIADENHYPKISNKISYETANEITGIDVRKDSTEVIPHPSEALKQIYMKGKTTYDKSQKKVQRTVNELDYENLYINVRNRNNSLNELLTCLDGIMQ